MKDIVCVLMSFVLLCCIAGCSCRQEPSMEPENVATSTPAVTVPEGSTTYETVEPTPNETPEALPEGPEQGELPEDEVLSAEETDLEKTNSPEPESSSSIDSTDTATPSPTPFWGGGELELPEDDLGK